MSKDSRIKQTALLLAEAKEAVALIGSGSPNVSNGGGWLSRLHKKLNNSIDTLYAKRQPCCPILMQNLKKHRLFIKQALENQKQSPPALA